MKILQIANGYLDTKLYDKLFTNLSNYEIYSTIYVPVNIKKKIKKNNSDVIISKCFSNIDRLLFFSKQNKMFHDVSQKLDVTAFDIIHAHTLFSGGYLAYKLNKKYNIPYIVAVRNTDINTFMKYMIHLRSTGIEILRNAAKVVFLSPVYRERLINKYVPEIDRKGIYQSSVVIPNGIDEFWHDNIFCRESTLFGKKLRLIFVGSIVPSKGIDVAVKTCKLLISEGYDIQFTMIGKISHKPYEKMIKSNEFIQHIDYSSKEVIMEHMRKADIFVMPSKAESFGLVYAEAMSQGLPVIYTEGEGFDGHFPEGEVGYHVDSSDSNDVVTKIYKILSDYNRISANCTQEVERFDWNKIAKTYYDLYHQIRKI